VLAKNKSLENFVVPLRIDDLRFEDTTIELQRILSIQFHPCGYRCAVSAIHFTRALSTTIGESLRETAGSRSRLSVICQSAIGLRANDRIS